MDIASLRADTPGCVTALHLNNAGGALMPHVPIRRTELW